MAIFYERFVEMFDNRIEKMGFVTLAKTATEIIFDKYFYPY